MRTLFDSLRLGELTLANRIFMAPLTRSRTGAGQADAVAFGKLFIANPRPATALCAARAAQ